MPYADPEMRRRNHREYMRRRYQTDPVHRAKQLARVKTQNAIKPPACSSCGSPNPEAHHEDYAKPNDRTWLCRSCHLEHHAAA